LKIEGQEGGIAYDAFFSVLNYWFKIIIAQPEKLGQGRLTLDS
jgi:hypothetical protein